MPRSFCLIVVALVAAASATVWAAPAPALIEEGGLRGERWLMASADPAIAMRVGVFRPPGRGPFRLVVINHGSSENAEDRASYPAPIFPVVTSWFLHRGYVVALPQRPGHGETGGTYLETAGSCEDPHYRRSGDATADSIRAALVHLMEQPFVRKTGALLVGHSAGAWGALALAGQSQGLVDGVINFAGGRGGHSYGVARRNCAPERLVAAAAEYGRAVRVPTLWLYAENDSYFDPDLSRRLAEAFRTAGGPAEYRLLPAVEPDGHYLMQAPEAVRWWAPIVEKFLGRLR
jgi:dienelactone hydrolase